jgi:hypothetical protein
MLTTVPAAANPPCRKAEDELADGQADERGDDRQLDAAAIAGEIPCHLAERRQCEAHGERCEQHEHAEHEDARAFEDNRVLLPHADILSSPGEDGKVRAGSSRCRTGDRHPGAPVPQAAGGGDDRATRPGWHPDRVEGRDCSTCAAKVGGVRTQLRSYTRG